MKSWRAPILGMIVFCIGAVSGVAQSITLLEGAPTDEPSLDASDKAAPVAPTKLQVLALRTDQVFLVWQDNSDNETNFRIEARTATGFFTELGTTPANNFAAFVSPLSPGTAYTFRVRASNADGSSAYSNEPTTTTRTTDACTPGATEICLNNNRFRIQALYQTTGTLGGVAHAVKLTTESGYLWFFDEVNIEAVVKVLNGCGLNNRYRVFGAGLTNVRVALAVTDTELLASKVYVNPLNTAFQPIQDTDALPSCL